jgi:hypothetical protein
MYRHRSPFLSIKGYLLSEGGERMATANLVNSVLVLSFDAGMDESGKPIVKRKSFNNIKTQATADQLYAISQALIPLQQYPVITIERHDARELYA